jgi:hypothetical protein
MEPAPIRATSGEPSHPQAIVTLARDQNPMTAEMIMAMKDPG